MGRRLREHDWHGSAVGPPESWPRVLRTVTELMISSRHPMFLAWGPELTFLYNDSYRPILGARHPQALGRPFRNVWPEIWDDLLPLVERALGGEATWSENLHLVMERNGFPEDTWYSFSYSPVRDEDGCIVGIFCAGIKTTGRVLAEAALRSASERSIEILESISDAFYTVDRDWRFTYINRKAEQLWGRRREELLGRVYWTEFPDAVGSAAYDAHLQVARTRQAAHFETISPTRQRWIEVNIYPSSDGGMSVYFRDITERKNSEAALRESEARFRSMADTVPVMIWATDATGYCTYLNRNWYEFTGQTVAEAEGFGWLDATHPEDRQRTDEIAQAGLRERRPFRIEYRLRRADGSYAYAIDAANPRFDENGAYLGHVGAVLDITDRRNSEQALQRLNETLEAQVAERTRDLRLNEARIRSIIETTFQYQGLLSPEGILLDTNRASLESISVQREDVLGQPFWTTPWFTATPGVPEMIRSACTLAAAGDSVHHELHLNLPLGQRSFDFSLRPVRNERGNVVAIVAEASDTTERRKTEESLRQSQKMEAMGQLTGGIAHDFNNLLTAVLGNLEIIQRRVTDERIRRLAQNAIRATERGARLTGQMLAFSRSQKLALRPVDVNAQLRGMDDLLDRSAGPTISLRVRLDEKLPPVMGDANQLEAAMLNLVINARDAMPEGGDLDISTRRVRISGDGELAAGEYVEIAIADTGIGMSPGVRSRAFDPFFTTKEIGKGTGLGLSQVFGFVRQAGGTARIESSLGRGTRVCLLLPVAKGEAAQTVERSPTPATDGGRGRILVIDDDQDVRTFLLESLDALGYETLGASDGESGLAMLAEAAPDLVLLDYAMPGLNGAEVAQAVRSRRPDLPVIFVTGYADQAAMKAAAADAPILQKPFRVADLAATLRGCLDGNRSSSS